MPYIIAELGGGLPCQGRLECFIRLQVQILMKQLWGRKKRPQTVKFVWSLLSLSSSARTLENEGLMKIKF